MVIAGIAGGDQGVRGFLSAYKADTGERVWRFWTVPTPGGPGSETWKGTALWRSMAERQRHLDDGGTYDAGNGHFVLGRR